MGDDISSGSVCYCFLLNLRSAAQFVTEPKPMSSPINYPAYMVSFFYFCKPQRNFVSILLQIAYVFYGQPLASEKSTSNCFRTSSSSSYIIVSWLYHYLNWPIKWAVNLRQYIRFENLVDLSFNHFAHAKKCLNPS